MMKPHKKETEVRLSEIGIQIAGELNEQGYWDGKLSPSALGVAVAVAALHFDDADKNAGQIQRGILWLRENINPDGSYGDTPESPGNVSTTLLAYAALNLYRQDEKNRQTQLKIGGYLQWQKIDVNSPEVIDFILGYYQKDYTFSVPILAMCGLCGVPGESAFQRIPQLPFELSLLPRRFYRMLNLSVVSYAIPALVAVGILISKKKKPGFFRQMTRRLSEKKAMRILHQMLPVSGGFLEAIPLTAFVSLSLLNSGYRETEVVKKGIHFLKRTQREDGSWPIDVDLSTWVTTLSVKAYRSEMDRFFSTGRQEKLAEHLKSIQNKKVHPFNGTTPGGWGWTHYSGSVPDGDDTPGAILALLKLQPENKVKNEVLAATEWLSRLQNKDGGIPTFSRGWGKLPFDRSCSDLTGHCLLAVSAVMESFHNELSAKENSRLEHLFSKALKYLKKNQLKDGSWLPLWFGNQLTEDHANPVYGTAKVTAYLKDTLQHAWLSHKSRDKLNVMVGRGHQYLIAVQNENGSWGGGKNIPGTMEETALAVSALASEKHLKVCSAGLNWLDRFYRQNGFKSAPIGLYFASLWYDEKMYPKIFYLEALTRMNELI
ncbi:MAG: prenyltransferase/squalene oxidase repeat-containing protein [Prolixibacteraceae bacterium]